MGLTRKQISTVAVLLIGTFVVVLNQTLLSPALASIMRDLSIDAPTVQWVMSIYSLVEAVVISLQYASALHHGSDHLHGWQLALRIFAWVHLPVARPRVPGYCGRRLHAHDLHSAPAYLPTREARKRDGFGLARDRFCTSGRPDALWRARG